MYHTVSWIISLDKNIIADVIDRNIPFEKLNIDPKTLALINAIKQNLPLPQIDDMIDDAIIHILFKKNMIADLERLSLPYVSYEIVNGTVINGTIKRLKNKSARKLFTE